MRIFLTAILSLFSFSLFAQKDSLPTKFYLGFSFSPDYCRVYSKAFDNDSLEKATKEDNKYSKPIFGFTTGLSAMYRFDNNFSIQAGVMYSEKGYQVMQDSVPTKGIERIRVTDRYRFLDFPVKLSYEWGKSKIHYNAGLGLAFNYVVANKTSATIFYTDSTSENINNLSQQFKHADYNVSPIVSGGVNYQLNDKIFFRSEVEFRMAMMPLFPDSEVSDFLYGVGMNFSVFYALK